MLRKMGFGTIASKSPMVLALFLVGGISFIQNKYFVCADSTLEAVASNGFNHINSFVRHDRDMNHNEKDTRYQHIITKTIGYDFPGKIARKIDGSDGIVASILHIMRNNISDATKPLDITNKSRSTGRNSHGYRSRRINRSKNPFLLTLRAGQLHSLNRLNSNSSGMVPGDRRAKLKLSSSIATNVPTISPPLITLNQRAKNLQNKLSTFVPTIERQDLPLVIVYVCTMIAITIPVILLPMIADDPGATVTHLTSKAAFVGAIVSLSTLGGSIGKFANGFVCKSMGGRMAGGIYLLGLTVCSLLLSITKSFHGLAIAGMEFFASIMWTSCNVILANRYGRDPKKLSTAVRVLSLGSTSGALLAKMLGTILLYKYHWRQVSRFAGLMALIGSMTMFFYVKDVAHEKKRIILGTNGGSQYNRFGINAIFYSAFRVLNNRAFWMVGFAHTTAYIARSSDKLLGSFVREVTGLPIYLCGSLTSSVTIGFVMGLISSRNIDLLTSPRDKKLFISRRYHRAALSAIGLALCANQSIGTFFSSAAHVIAIAFLSGMMAYSVAFQFYQFPTAFANTFDDDRAVCISFMDGIACLVMAPIWSLVSMLAASAQIGSHGWSVAWLIIASLFGIGGNVMMRNLSSVIPSINKES